MARRRKFCKMCVGKYYFDYKDAKFLGQLFDINVAAGIESLVGNHFFEDVVNLIVQIGANDLVYFFPGFRHLSKIPWSAPFDEGAGCELLFSRRNYYQIQHLLKESQDIS